MFYQPNLQVIVPGYASDASQYRRLEASFRRRGIPAWTVPLSSLMWAPTFGGRSIRPVLDRLHATVLDVALKGRPLPPTGAGAWKWSICGRVSTGLLYDHDHLIRLSYTSPPHTHTPTEGEVNERPSSSSPTPPNPAGQYSLGAFLREMADPSQGAVFPITEGGAAVGGAEGGDPPSTQAFGREDIRYRVALVRLGGMMMYRGSPPLEGGGARAMRMIDPIGLIIFITKRTYIPHKQVAHSAGGWISRLYLSTAVYDGRAYNGARFVSTLVTLGSPHVRARITDHLSMSPRSSISPSVVMDHGLERPSPFTVSPRN